LRSDPAVRFTDIVTHRSMPVVLAFVAGITLSTVAIGQNRSVYAPPPDLNSPPADAVKSPSGLVSKVLTPGKGDEKPKDNDMISVDYTAWTSEGNLHDSSVSRGKPSMFPLNRTALKGWSECVQLMVVGEKRRCWMPEALAYAGVPNRPKGQLVFDIELLATYPNPTVAPPDVKEPPSDARRTASGLAYKILREGTGRRNPGPRDKVLVHYSGWTTNGRLFDSSLAKGEPLLLGLDEFITGWSEGLQLMVEGQRNRLWIPQNLAYKGEAGSPRGMLVFDVELLRIQ
jgi:FKBP-type peptidyl-prolyl cis-trans isomerase